MRIARHPLWPAVVIFTLLLVTQLSYAEELCPPVAGQGAMHPATMQDLQTVSSAGLDCGAHPGCVEADSQSRACTASRIDPSLSDVALANSFEPGNFAGTFGPQSTLAVRTASGAPPKLVATTHRPLRTLFCRYLI